MQKSDELREAVLVIYEQLQQLNFESKACNIIIIDKESGSAQYWVSGFSQEIFPESYTVPYLNHPYQDALLKPWKQGEKYVVYEYTGKMKQRFDKIFFTQTEFRNVPEDAKKVMIGLESVILVNSFHQLWCITDFRMLNLFQKKKQIFLNASQKFLNRPIPVFLICKKQKHRQEKHRLNWHWKEFVQEPWPCRKVMSCRKQRPYFLNNLKALARNLCR